MLQEEEIKTGLINFTTVPEGASIFLNNINQETLTSCTIGNVPIGFYLFKIELEGYDIVVGSLDVKENEILDINIELSPINENMGSIYIETSVPNAKVYMDDILVENTTPLFLDNILLGNYIITIKLDDYEDYTKLIYINNGEMLYLYADLIKISELSFDYNKLILPGLLVGVLGVVIYKENKKND